MGKQSSRLIYQGTDIKDLYYQGKRLFKLYKGNQLVWEKLGVFCLPTTAFKIFDLYTNEWERGSEYTISTKVANSSRIIAVLAKGGERHIAISKKLTEWKTISEIEYISEDFRGFGKKDSGFYVYNKNKIYSVDVELGLDYQISEIDLTKYNTQYFGVNAGISDYAYIVYYERNWRLVQISPNGEIKTGKLGYPFNVSGIDISLSQMIVGNENVFLIANAQSSTAREVIIYKIKNMDTDNLYVVYRGALNNSQIDVIYDNYQTVFFIHNVNLEQFAYYLIDLSGNFLKISEKTDDSIKQITLPLYGAEGYGLIDIIGHPAILSELTVKFIATEQYKTTSEYIAEGTYPYASLEFHTASHYNSESLYVDDGFYNKECVICTTKTFNTSYNGKISAKRILIFIDNLFWEESENNYAILIDAN